MKHSQWKEINSFLQSLEPLKLQCWEVLKQVKENFITVKAETLISIVLQWYAKVVVDVQPRKYRKGAYSSYKRKVKELGSSVTQGAIYELAKSFNLPPTVYAGFILNQYVEQNFTIDNNAARKKKAKKFLSNPFSIPDKRLSKEVRHAIVMDDAYGPLVTVIRELTGEDMERLLNKELERIHCKCNSEDELRRIGTDKTPDCLLVVPKVVDGVTVKWIESKALFADESTHQAYYEKQYKKYVDRFGSGVVIYFHDFVEELADEAKKNGILIKNKVPEIREYCDDEAEIMKLLDNWTEGNEYNLKIADKFLEL